MCRSIKRLRQPDRLPTELELREASLQFVRKISGFRVPSRSNQAAFDAAVDEVTEVAERLFLALAPGRTSVNGRGEATAEAGRGAG
jgi:hypothetical protein